MRNEMKKMMVLGAIAALSLSQFAFAADPAAKAKKKPAKKAPVVAAAPTKAAKAEPKVKQSAVTAEDLKELKGLLEAQQHQLNDLRDQVAQRDQQLQSAQQQITEAKKIAEEASQKATAVETSNNEETKPAVAALKEDVTGVKDTLTSAVQTTQDEQKRTTSLESAVSRFKWSADARVRGEFYKQDSVQSRFRERIRIRLGVEGKLSDDFVAGLALATGGYTGSFTSNGSQPDIDPTSTNETLTNDFTRKNISLDKGYITWKPSYAPWFEATGGKFAYTWTRTSVTFDADLNPEGFSQKMSFDIKNRYLKNVSLTGIQLVYNETYNQLKQANDSWAYGFQYGMKLQPTSWWSLTPTYSLLNWRIPNVILTNNATAAFNPNGISNCVNAAKTAYCGGFLYSDLILTNTFKTPYAKLPINLVAEFERNLNAAPAVIKANGDRKYRNSAYYFDLSIGQTKNKGDFQLGYTFNREEQDAVISAFGESDQRWPTNVLQHKLYANFKVGKNVTLGYTQWMGRALDSRLAVTGGWAYAPGYGPGGAKAGQQEPILHRGQLDLVYTF